MKPFIISISLSLNGMNDMKHVSMYEWCLYPLMHKHVHISTLVYLVLQKPSLLRPLWVNVGLWCEWTVTSDISMYWYRPSTQVIRAYLMDCDQ